MSEWWWGGGDGGRWMGNLEKCMQGNVKDERGVITLGPGADPQGHKGL